MSITHFTEQTETIQGMKGKAGVIEACTGSDRRKLGVTVSAQVMTDKGKGRQGIGTGDNRSREGSGGYVQEMRGDDRGSIQGVMGMMRIPTGTGNSKISLE